MPKHYPVVTNTEELDSLCGEINYLESLESLPGTTDYELLLAYRAIRDTYVAAKGLPGLSLRE